ncbi:hypothetical protein FACS189421_03760 [Bacteroidia bacterium]|nr:hypothetical protein FACS189421_03760 [Bacteroidia bacterium]GHT51156.1 hypothetical protein FACS189440_19790 [Bacteroidia bacterium]
MILGAVGKNATGKDYFLEYISKKYSIPMFSVGDVVRELALKDGLEHTRENLHKTSQKYMTQFGQDFFPNQIVAKIKELDINKVLVSGIRPLSDVVALKSAFGSDFILVDIVVADDNIRFERMKKRGSARDPLTKDKFLEHDRHEEELFHTSETEKMADFIVYNDGTAEEFDLSIDKFYKEHLLGK